MNAEQIARKLETVRSDLGNAGASKESRERIDSLSLAVELLTDVVEYLSAQQAATDRRIDAIGRSMRAIAERGE